MQKHSESNFELVGPAAAMDREEGTCQRDLHVHEGVAGGHMRGSLKLYILKGRTQSFLLPLVCVFSLTPLGPPF